MTKAEADEAVVEFQEFCRANGMMATAFVKWNELQASLKKHGHHEILEACKQWLIDFANSWTDEQSRLRLLRK